MAYGKGMMGVAYLKVIEPRRISIKCFLIWHCLHKLNYSIGQSKPYYFCI